MQKCLYLVAGRAPRLGKLSLGSKNRTTHTSLTNPLYLYDRIFVADHREESEPPLEFNRVAKKPVAIYVCWELVFHVFI